MAEFRMPSLGADMEAGTLVEWLKAPGDEVSRGDIIAVVETQKGAIEVEVFEDGVIDKLLVEEGQTVPVGTPLALIDGDKAGASAAESREVQPVEGAPAARTETPARERAEPLVRESEPARRRISPAARKLAAESGIDLSGIKGSGPGDAVVWADVEAATRDVGKKKAPGRKASGLDLDAMREAIAAAMARSKREIPHYYLRETVDFEPASKFVAEVNANREPADRLLPTVLLIKAVAHAVKAFPGFNGFYQEGAFRQNAKTHVGTAIALRGGGLIAPALHDADEKSLDELMAALRDLVDRTRRGRLRSSELSDPTITVTALGERGVEAVYGIIYPPQVAIVGFGRPRLRPWVTNGDLTTSTVVETTLAADHRVTDGHKGANFLNRIGHLLQKPENL